MVTDAYVPTSTAKAHSDTWMSDAFVWSYVPEQPLTFTSFLDRSDGLVPDFAKLTPVIVTVICCGVTLHWPSASRLLGLSETGEAEAITAAPPALVTPLRMCIVPVVFSFGLVKRSQPAAVSAAARTTVLVRIDVRHIAHTGWRVGGRLPIGDWCVPGRDSPDHHWPLGPVHPEGTEAKSRS